ncbi:MAG: permease-like cell division protein FtsX [Eubacteriales bacterium]|nr:permease-like cell division protein FtsX [Eubacteriales bacterium]
MSLRTLSYSFSQGLQNLFKNGWMSVVSIMTIAINVFVITVFYTVVTNINFMMTEFEKNIGVAVFFEDNTTEEQILALKLEVEKRSEVYRVEYISAEAAWESFKEQYFGQKEELLVGFGSDNPLAKSASLQISLADISKQGTLVQVLESETIVRYVRETRDVTHVVEALNKLVTYVSLGLLIILILLALFLISNTIRLAVTLRNEEISIMRYIGARNMMIRGPFIVEGILIGLIGASLPLVLFYYTYPEVVIQIQKSYAILSEYLIFLSRDRILQLLIPISLGSGAALGYLGSRITVGKYLKV